MKEDRESFLQFLKDLLKDNPYVELAYMTGVLPIVKYSSGSALNMFKEYNMMNDSKFDKYFSFTHNEVKELYAKQSNVSLDELAELKDYIGKKLAVGISWDSKLKNHKVKLDI